MKIATKLPIVIAVAGVIAAVITGYIGASESERAVEQAVFDKLEAVQEGRIARLESYLKSIEEDLQIMAKNDMVIDGLEEFEEALDEMGGMGAAAAYQSLAKAYIDDNPNAAGEKHKLDRAPEDTAFNRVHGKYHPFFRELLERRGYYDIFMVDNTGNVIYSVYKEADFATNLLEGKWKDSDIGVVYRKVLDNFKEGYVGFTDFAPYAPSAGAPASFIAAPIFEDDGGVHGVLIYQMPVGRINEIMQQEAGMGESGESYIVGGDYLMRSDSRFSKESTILKQKIDTEPVRKALAGDDNVVVANDYRGIEVLSAYGPMEFNGVTWAVLAEMDMEEVDIPIVEMQQFMMLATLAVIAVIGGIGFAFARSITGPIANMTDKMTVIAEGNLEIDVPSRDRTDEIGEMAAAVQVFKENGLEVRRLAEEQKAAEVRAEKEKREMMLSMADDFENSVGGVVNSVSSASTEMRSSAESVSSTADTTSKQAATVAAASEEASTNVQTVASASEELSSSISEISRQVAQSTQIAGQAVTEVEGANTKVRGLANAANKIGEVVALITDIADQTNLLALNATIEAARAGEAGKGFAVVASEVKNLANQTAKATEEISTQIGGIQGATQEAVDAIESIGGIINQMSEISSTIAAAVEEQGAATQEIARNVEQAAAGTNEVASTIQQVNESAGETGSSAEQMMEAARELSQQSETLRAEVDKFLSQIRSG